MSVIKMADLDLNGKRVLIREDLNVPVKEGTADATNVTKTFNDLILGSFITSLIFLIRG